MSERFDDLIRGKLAGARHGGAPDWVRLRDELAGASFDELLAVGVGGGGATSDGAPQPDWEGLSAKLTAEVDASGAAFDELIARRVAHAAADAAPGASWRQLSHRMDTLWPLRRRLVRYRVLELAAAAAFLVTFLPLLRDNAALAPEGGLAEGHAPYRRPTTGAPAPALALADRPDGTPSSAHTDEEGAAYSPLRNLADALGMSDLSTRLLTPAELEALYQPSLTAVGPTAGGPWGRGAGAPAILPHAVGPTAAHPAPRVGAPVAPSAPTIASLPSARALGLVRASAPAPGTFVLPRLPTRDNPWSFGASASRKIWRVSTPTDVEFDRGSSVLSAPATAVGAHVLRDLGPRWRLGLSVASSSARYDAGLPAVQRRATVTQAGYDLVEDFRAIDLGLAQATLDTRVGLLPPDQVVQVWAKAGVGANAVLRAAYDLRRSDAPTPPAAADLSASGGAEALATTQKTVERPFTLTDRKDFAPGLLQGGALTESTQVFGRLGAEAEVRLGSRLRVFGGLDVDVPAPGQQGFGPNRDRFGSYEIGFGARVSL